MEASYDSIPAPYRSERLRRMKDLIHQMEADHDHIQALQHKIAEGAGTEKEMEDFLATSVMLRREYKVYRRMRSISIEGVTCGWFDEFRI